MIRENKASLGVALPLIVLLTFMAFLCASSLAQTVTLNDTDVVQQSPMKVGMNLAAPSPSNTTITIPAASGDGIKIADIVPPGVNLSSTTPANYGPANIAANLLFSMNGYFAPQVWSGSMYCAGGGTTTTWPTAITGSTVPADFFAGASYQVIQPGSNFGDTGTITASTDGTPGPITLTLSNALSADCSDNDIMIVRQFSPPSDWVGTVTPATMTEYGYYNWFNSSTGATASFETNDLDPGTGASQHLEIVAPSTDSGQLYFLQDVGTPFYVALNGTYKMTFGAKGTTGTPTVTVSVARGSTSYLDETVTPTVSSSPGEGWTNYSYSFTGSETNPTEALAVSLTVTGGTAILADVALTEQPVSGNTTPLRNAVYEELLAMHPGVVRYNGFNMWACNVQDELAEEDAVRMCDDSWYGAPYQTSPGFTLPDVLAVANAIGAAPWFVYSLTSSPDDAAAIVEYLAGTCGNGNTYTTMRCDQGQTEPYTTLFAAKGQKIYLELCNECWNSGNGGGSIWGSIQYGTLLGEVDAAMEAAPDWTPEIVRVANGNQTSASGGLGDWIAYVMSNSSATTNGQPDAIDGSPYLGTFVTQAASNADIFPPMFSEAYSMDSTSIGDSTYTPLQTTSGWLATNYPATQFLAYEETADNAQYFLTGTDASQINGIAAGVGSGIASVLHQLLMLRDSGVSASTMYAAFQARSNAYLCTSTSGGCSSSGSTPVWGSNLFSLAPDNMVDRPVGYAFQLMNSAISTNKDLLNVSLADQPMWSQAPAQPDPTNSGTDSILANPSVPYVDAFGFSDGSGHYSLICFNLNTTSDEDITFAGAAAPTGTVTKTVFTSANPTDNNESVTPGETPTVPLPTPTTLTNPTGDTLASDSMTTYTWTIGISSPPTMLSGQVALSGGITIQ